jgi:hypothetical protein
VVEVTSHANQATLYRTPPRGRGDVLKRLLAKIGTAVQHIKAPAEQFKNLDRGSSLLCYVNDRIARVIGPPKPPPGLAATG